MVADETYIKVRGVKGYIWFIMDAVSRSILGYRVSTEFRPYKQMVERLNRTFKSSYRMTCGYDGFEGSDYSVALWVAYYNFLRPHKNNSFRPLNHLNELDGAENMPAKWQILIRLGQETILRMQNDASCF